MSDLAILVFRCHTFIYIFVCFSLRPILYKIISFCTLFPYVHLCFYTFLRPIYPRSRLLPVGRSETFSCTLHTLLSLQACDPLNSFSHPDLGMVFHSRLLPSKYLAMTLLGGKYQGIRSISALLCVNSQCSSLHIRLNSEK